MPVTKSRSISRRRRQRSRHSAYRAEQRPAADRCQRPARRFNDVQINLVNGGNIGNTATAVYNSGSKTLTLTIDDSGETEIGTLITQINATGVFTAARDTTAGDTVIDNTATIPNTAFGTNVANTAKPAATPHAGRADRVGHLDRQSYHHRHQRHGATFTARLDPSEGNNGQRLGLRFDDRCGDDAVTTAGSGRNFDTTGLQIVNAARRSPSIFSTAETVDDLLNQIQRRGSQRVGRDQRRWHGHQSAVAAERFGFCHRRERWHDRLATRRPQSNGRYCVERVELPARECVVPRGRSPDHSPRWHELLGRSRHGHLRHGQYQQ